MSTVQPPTDPESDPRVKAVFDDIRATRNTTEINALWHYLSFDAILLEETWRDVKGLMAQETEIDFKTKEMLYLAVSISNACDYCVHSHTAAAKARGMSDQEHGELLRIVALASRTNALANGLKPPIDEAFDRDKT